MFMFSLKNLARKGLIVLCCGFVVVGVNSYPLENGRHVPEDSILQQTQYTGSTTVKSLI